MDASLAGGSCFVGLFDLTQIALDRALTGANTRQGVLSNNVANANTPGFLPSDVDFHSAIQAAMSAGNAEGSLAETAFTPQQSGGPITADGNGVDMDVQMANLSENALDYEALTAVSHARLNMLSTVIGH
jgi:flagellar basal-body rod protein FlgB